MFNRRAFFACAAVLGAGVLAVTAGCDWFSGSDPGSRQSPFLSSPRVEPSSVLCAQSFNVSFHYDDPQGDIAFVRVTFLRSGDTVPREESPVWPNPLNRTSGTVSFPFTFPCSATGGDYSVTIQVEDERAHTSNIVSTSVKLNAAG